MFALPTSTPHTSQNQTFNLSNQIFLRSENIKVYLGRLEIFIKVGNVVSEINKRLVLRGVPRGLG